MIVVERNGHVFLGSRAELVVPGGRDLAWAERHVRTDKHLSYIIGNFVEANRPNQNGQTFTLEDLKDNAASLTYKPLNWLHRDRDIVGTYIGSEIVYPEVADDGANPILESAAAFYRFLFPDHFKVLEKAHAEGTLFTSMETEGETVTCNAPGCGQTYPYAGPMSPTYCTDMQKPRAMRTINKPHFGGGGIIVPPVRPGWYGAAVSDMSELERWIETNLTEAEMVYDEIAAEFPHLEPREWESMMAALIGRTDEMTATPYDSPALPDGSWNVLNAEDLKRRVQDATPGDEDELEEPRQHLIRRAAALGLSGVIPPEWADMYGDRASLAVSVWGDYDAAYELARAFTNDKRAALAKSGKAIPIVKGGKVVGGRYPIATVSDLKNAIKAIGRAKDPGKAKALIKRRASALNADGMVPAGW